MGQELQARRQRGWAGWAGLLPCIVLLGCSSNDAASDLAVGAGGRRSRDVPAPPIEQPGANYLTDAQSEALEVELGAPDMGELAPRLASARSETAQSLAASRSLEHLETLSYDPLEAAGLDLIQASALELGPSELQLLGERGFAIIPRLEFPSFAYGYDTIYAQDLPVFITADMVLEAVHRSFNAILGTLESELIIPDLQALLAAMQERLASGSVELSVDTARDLDVYLSVARQLLDGTNAESPAPVSSNDVVEELVRAALSGAGERRITLFGTERLFDFSQFVPRGPYTDSEERQRYFRSMIWLGRTDFRLIETMPDGSRVFRPRQLQAALALEALLDEQSLGRWQRIDNIVGAFVGEHDYMTLPELDELREAVGVADAASLAAVPGERIAQAILAGQFGQQRIASQIMRREPGSGTVPLDASFAFFGQRYTVDSHVFSNLVYDRVGGGAVARVVPNPLDVAFAGLGNDQAVDLLSNELATHAYAGDLALMRELVDSHPGEYWQSSLYTAWLAALRSLSPGAEGTPLDEPGLPEVARTEGWGRRLLNTQLASWAELRHDTILYAKQSYTSGDLCEFPDAYVDPYPEFFHAIARFAERGAASLQAFESDSDDSGFSVGSFVLDYFQRLATISNRLGEMAEYQRTGQPHTAEQLAFINEAIRINPGCGSPTLDGWYTGLFFDPSQALEFDPTIADVHTDPGGVRPVSRPPSVLHVATGNVRLMVMTRETCAGPRAYAGMVFSYHEHIEQGMLTRLTDEIWKERFMSASARPDDVPWLAEVLAR